MTTNGAVCWDRKLGVPSNIDFNFYLTYTLEILYKTIGMQDDVQKIDQEKLENFSKILLLSWQNDCPGKGAQTYIFKDP